MQQTWKRIKWIGGYARQHIWAIAVYTLLGLAGTGISLLGSLVSKDLIDIITGHETGQVVDLLHHDRHEFRKFVPDADFQLHFHQNQYERGCRY